MITINSTRDSAIYLIHNELINKSYNQCTEIGHYQKYMLKPQLFDFKPKLVRNTHLEEESNNLKVRKRRAVIDHLHLSAGTIDLKQTCDYLLAKLKESTDGFKYFQKEYAESIPRIWEELTVFPQFNGANARNDFQKYILNNREYLIPPHCRFFNHDLLKLEDISQYLGKFDFIVLDPPWKNKYVRRIKKAKQELGYKMLDYSHLSNIKLNSLFHSDSIVAVWCTNSKKHQQMLLEEFFPKWDLKFIHKMIWLKLNTAGVLIGEINEKFMKQPYEILFIASHCASKKDFSEMKIKFIMSVPSVIHSHKPPILDIFRDILPANPKALELFARYLQPGFTSIGLEVLKLMDTRLYFQNKE